MKIYIVNYILIDGEETLENEILGAFSTAENALAYIKEKMRRDYSIYSRPLSTPRIRKYSVLYEEEGVWWDIVEKILMNVFMIVFIKTNAPSSEGAISF